MFKVLKSVYIFESTRRFIYAHISTVWCGITSYFVIFSLVVGLTKFINSRSPS